MHLTFFFTFSLYEKLHLLWFSIDEKIRKCFISKKRKKLNYTKLVRTRGVHILLYFLPYRDSKRLEHLMDKSHEQYDNRSNVRDFTLRVESAAVAFSML